MMRQILHRLAISAGMLLVVSTLLPAQNARNQALEYLRANSAKFGLSAADVADVKVTDNYVSQHNGITHVWMQQQHTGIPVFNALIGLHVKTDGQVFSLGHRFVPGLAGKINTNLPSLSAAKAVEMAMLNLGFSSFAVPQVREKINEQNWVFDGGAISRSNIPVSACYEVNFDGRVRLAWTMVIEEATSSNVWSMRVDAQTGEILDKINFTVYCKAGHVHKGGESCSDEVVAAPAAVEKMEGPTNVNGTYRVFALPAESPAHGPHVLVTDPADPIASPFGWHDTNGAAGPEFTYPRGNNVYAYEDSDDDNLPPTVPFPNPGASLNFDYPFDPNAEPEANLEAAIVNLFYMNNMMHDITSRYGFDAPAGNFQVNNYGQSGLGNDAVQAEAIDGSGEDNANFSTPPDGSPGRMQMYKWTRRGGNIVRVNAPGAILGTYAATATSGWGAVISTTAVTGDVVVANDGTASATAGCFDLVNDVAGKIVMVDRGECEFGQKALNAQNAGAVGCIICNFEDATIGMAAGTVGGAVTIPVVMMTKSDCDLLRGYVGNGLNISLVQPSQAGPDFLDADFDNGIIAHEYGHGISNRLTGGPSQAGCLGNGEQMGEGWSDWFSLVTAVKPGDVADGKRGVGTYVIREPNNGTGIRRYPYSTDMNINPITFGTVAESSGVHAIGEIWAATNWDLYWAFVEKYGYDADLTNPNSGNARAIQHVLDGMKLQPCEPGFIDGRDAIMLANILNYDGVDTCLISSVYARRGMGIGASQGDSNNSADGVESFDPIPTCIKELKIKKTTSTPLISAGENAEFTITVTNHKTETATGVVVTDELPAGLSFVSASNGGNFNGSTVTWNIGNMPVNQTLVLTYTAKASNTGSTRYFQDVMDTDDNWISLVATGSAAFSLQSDQVKTGNAAWRAFTLEEETDMTLETFQTVTVTGNQPVLRFWHNYNTQGGFDAGFIDIQIDGETQWRRFSNDEDFRNGYPSAVSYDTYAIPFLDGFSGNSNGWIQSYFDLSAFAGQTIRFRFRFGTDVANAVPNGYWTIDEIDIIDMVNYDAEACITANGGDQACARAPQRGVILEVGSIISTEEPGANSFQLAIQPNPARDMAYLSAGQDLRGDVQVRLFSADGRLVQTINTQNLLEGQYLPIDVQNLPTGMYLVRVDNAAGSSVKKLMK
ncbi:MAG: M36 family metallopeptidase [Saprospiraceae bacterium]|nr:M36 family metallopeptidase [Saprospiraceae bacterium]